MTVDKHFVMPSEQRPEALDVLGTKVTVLAAASATNCYGMTFQEGEEGTGPPPHCHDWDETFYVLSGEIHFICGEENHACLPGTLVHVPRNTVHGFNYGKGGGSMMEITSRDSRSSEMFTAIDAGVDPQAPDIPKILEILANNGVTVSS